MAACCTSRLPHVGFDPAWLREQKLVIDFRKGGERLKLAANRPTRGLKAHYQAADIPAWERARLPTVSSGRELLFAAGLGMDCHHFAPERRRLHCLALGGEAPNSFYAKTVLLYFIFV